MQTTTLTSDMYDTGIMSDFHSGAFTASVALKCHGEEYMQERFKVLKRHASPDFVAGYIFFAELPHAS